MKAHMKEMMGNRFVKKPWVIPEIVKLSRIVRSPNFIKTLKTISKLLFKAFKESLNSNRHNP